MDDKKGNRVRRILEAKRQPPEYQRLDLEPKEGGRSLLHDEFGIPKVSPTPKNKGDIPVMEDIPNEPVQVKASLPSQNVKVPTGIPKKGSPLPSVGDDDGFFPPRANFVAVGQKEHTWYAPEVTGPSRKKESVDDVIIDNNDEVDVESLQGADPFADLKTEEGSEIRQKFERILSMIEEDALASIYSAPSLDDLDEVRSKIFGKSSDLTTLLKEFKNIPTEERRVVGEIVNYAVENIKLEIQAKKDSLEIEDESEEEFTSSEDRSSSDDNDKGYYPTQTAKISSLQEGFFAILVDDKLYSTAQDAISARDILSKLILGNNIEVTRVQVIKRVPIDFGIILGD